MPKSHHIPTLLICTLLALPAAAEELLETRRSWDGEAFHYPEGDPQVTSVMLKVGEGQVMPWHCHPVPTLGYVMKGNLKVETLAGKTVTLTAGDPVVEVMNTLHRGVGLEGGAEILVFYAGATDLPTTVLRDDGDSARFCTGEH